MFFSVARLRLVAISFFALPLVHAHEDVICVFSSRLISFYLVLTNSVCLVTSSVSYCAPPENLLVEQFDVSYFPLNNSLVFNISAASVVR